MSAFNFQSLKNASFIASVFSVKPVRRKTKVTPNLLRNGESNMPECGKQKAKKIEEIMPQRK